MQTAFYTNADSTVRTALPPKKIGILGGTFNPPHKGHLDIAETLAREFSLDVVLMIPVGDPPHKRDYRVEPKERRARMVELLCRGSQTVMPCMIEVEREGYTYTVDTMTALTSAFPEAEFYYIVGTDTLYQLTTWKDFRRVFELTRFICIYRPGDELADVCRHIEALAAQYGARIQLSQNSGLDISSTEIRTALLSGGDTSRWLTAEVAAYIKDNALYRNDGEVSTDE